MEMCIDTKKRELLCNFFILACPGCFWQDRAFEVAERSEVGALESLASNLVRLAALAALAFYQKRLPNY